MQQNAKMWKLLLVLVLPSLFFSARQACADEQQPQQAKQPLDVSSMPIIKYLWYGFDLLGIQRSIGGKISVDLSAAVQSKHMWHGFDLYDDHGVFTPAAGVTSGDTGFSGKVIGAYPLSGGLEKSEQLVYAAFYAGAFLKDTRYVTNFTTNYFYYGLPKIPGRHADAQEGTLAENHVISGAME
jgi:hypothetical protein